MGFRLAAQHARAVPREARPRARSADPSGRASQAQARVAFRIKLLMLRLNPTADRKRYESSSC